VQATSSRSPGRVEPRTSIILYLSRCGLGCPWPYNQRRAHKFRKERQKSSGSGVNTRLTGLLPPGTPKPVLAQAVASACRLSARGCWRPWSANSGELAFSFIQPGLEAGVCLEPICPMKERNEHANRILLVIEGTVLTLSCVKIKATVALIDAQINI
jgi:hypothetical protein